MLALRPFVAALPQALLGRDGGALAAVGHVDRVWSYSFLWPGAGTQTATFRSVLSALHDGRPVGSALEYVSGRYAELAADLSGALTEREQGRRLPDRTVAELWAACTDARSFVLLGDPRSGYPLPPAHGSRHRSERPSPSPHPAQSRRGSAPTPTPGPARPRPRSGPIEVLTYVADDPAATTYDPSTGRITGAVPVVFSHVERDGRAAHVIRSATGHVPIDPGEREAVVALHARLIAVSLDRAAARAEVDGQGGAHERLCRARDRPSPPGRGDVARGVAAEPAPFGRRHPLRQ